MRTVCGPVVLGGLESEALRLDVRINTAVGLHIRAIGQEDALAGNCSCISGCRHEPALDHQPCRFSERRWYD